MPGLLQNRIETAVPDEGSHTVAIGWRNGARTTFDMKPAIAQGGVFSALADAAVFGGVRVGPRGRSLQWPGDIDIDADAIWFDAHPEDNPLGKPAAAE